MGYGFQHRGIPVAVELEDERVEAEDCEDGEEYERRDAGGEVGGCHCDCVYWSLC